MRSGVALEGKKQLLAKFVGLEGAMDRPEVENACLRAAQIIRNRTHGNIRRNFNRKTGRLFRSVIARKFKRRRKGDPGAMVAIDRKIAPHAHLLELGHFSRGRFVGPKPFFRPAVDSSRGAAWQQITKGIKGALKAETRRILLKRTF